jgi:uncharacterized protein YciI
MKHVRMSLIFAAFLISVCLVYGQTPADKAVTHQKTKYLLIYRPGPGWVTGKPLAEQPLKEHGKYMLDLYSKGTIKFAGPFLDDSGGAMMFEAENENDAKAVVASDPAVRSGVFVAELHPWGLVDWEQYVKKPGPSTK